MQSIEHYERQRRDMPTGICRCCHCTEDRACMGGCAWSPEKDICTKCLTVVLSDKCEKGQLVDGIHPWCCDAAWTSLTGPIFMEGSSWVVRAARIVPASRGMTMVLAVDFCPCCGKKLPDLDALHALWKTVTKTRRK